MLLVLEAHPRRVAAMSQGPRQWPERPGMKDARERIRNGRRVKPNDSDAPPLSTFPGPKHKPLEGQLRLESPKD